LLQRSTPAYSIDVAEPTKFFSKSCHPEKQTLDFGKFARNAENEALKARLMLIEKINSAVKADLLIRLGATVEWMAE
jgi:hypothetical protein